jgi:hypothetical protein
MTAYEKVMDQVVWEGACLIFTGSADTWGYGNLYDHGRTVRAHRVVLEQLTGPHPNLLALHSCDNPLCCNYWHLRWGTHADNMRDRAERERGGPTKLTAEKVRAIRADSRSLRVIAADYGVTFSNIRQIKTGQTWQHVTTREDERWSSTS